MYLNDSDFNKALIDIKSCCKSGTVLYLKESMALTKRLTLNNIYSQSLTQNYSAIYRSITEYREAFSKYFKITKDDVLYDETLHNRVEAKDYYFIAHKRIRFLLLQVDLMQFCVDTFLSEIYNL